MNTNIKSGAQSRPFPSRPFTPVDQQTETQQLRQMIADLQNQMSALTARVAALENT